jgi:hypothetical protein
MRSSILIEEACFPDTGRLSWKMTPARCHKRMDFIQHIRWRPGIGDPTVMGFLTVGAYGLAALTALAAARKARRSPETTRGSRGLWLAVAALMAFLCVNKQLDLQSLLTDIGRLIAWDQGWYQNRREFQKWFSLGVVAVSLLITGYLIFRFRDFWRRHFLLGSGLTFLLTFIVVRAISFHHFEVFLVYRVAGVKMNWFLELSGIALVWLAAIMDFRNPERAALPLH